MNDFRYLITTAADQAADHMRRARALVSMLQAAASGITEQPGATDTITHYGEALTDVLSELSADIDELRADGLRAAMIAPDVQSTPAAILDGVTQLSPRLQRMVLSVVYGMLRDSEDGEEGKA